MIKQKKTKKQVLGFNAVREGKKYVPYKGKPDTSLFGILKDDPRTSLEIQREWRMKACLGE